MEPEFLSPQQISKASRPLTTSLGQDIQLAILSLLRIMDSNLSPSIQPGNNHEKKVNQQDMVPSTPNFHSQHGRILQVMVLEAAEGQGVVVATAFFMAKELPFLKEAGPN